MSVDVGDLDIDKNSLDVELSKQPSLYFKYSELWVRASDQRDILKAKMEEIKSNCYNDIKSKKAVSGGKITEAALSEAVNVHPDYVAARLSFIDANKNFLTLSNVLEALKQKQKSISKLCDLFLANYYIKDVSNMNKSERNVKNDLVDMSERVSSASKVKPVRKNVA